MVSHPASLTGRIDKKREASCLRSHGLNGWNQNPEATMEGFCTPGLDPCMHAVFQTPEQIVLTLFQMAPSLFKGKRKEPGK